MTAAEILSEINRWDFHKAAKGYGIDDDEAVDRAIASLKLDSADGVGGVRFRLTYGRPQRRPILIHIHRDPEVITEEKDEEEELLDEATGQGVDRVRAHLGQTVEVVAVELGWSQLEDMGVVFAWMVSEYLAVVGDGLIRDPHDVWWGMEDNVPVQIAGPG
jgi:hypothetical protein